MTPFLRRDKVIKAIGFDKLDAFEMWAFKADKPETYDNNLAYRWNNAHSGSPLPYHPDHTLDKILSIWKERFEKKEIHEEKLCFITIGEDSSDDDVFLANGVIVHRKYDNNGNT